MIRIIKCKCSNITFLNTYDQNKRVATDRKIFSNVPVAKSRHLMLRQPSSCRRRPRHATTPSGGYTALSSDFRKRPAYSGRAFATTSLPRSRRGCVGSI